MQTHGRRWCRCQGYQRSKQTVINQCFYLNLDTVLNGKDFWENDNNIWWQDEESSSGDQITEVDWWEAFNERNPSNRYVQRMEKLMRPMNNAHGNWKENGIRSKLDLAFTDAMEKMYRGDLDGHIHSAWAAVKKPSPHITKLLQNSAELVHLIGGGSMQHDVKTLVNEENMLHRGLMPTQTVVPNRSACQQALMRKIARRVLTVTTLQRS